jgi:hypothetical protein
MKISFLSLILMLPVLFSCATTGSLSQTGIAIVNNHKEAGFVTSEVEASKSGRACSENWAGIITLGDSSIEEAKTLGGITKVASVDYEYFKAIFYGRVCTIVRGN